MTKIAVWRLYLLRLAYFIIAAGLGFFKLPALFHHAAWGVNEGVVNCVLAAMAILAVLGIRYPVQMLPLLFFEVTWKSLWLVVVALPLWTTHSMDAATTDMAFAVGMVIILLPLIPWDVAYRNFVTAAGDRWH